MQCSKCGSKLEINARFCVNCGQKVEQEQSQINQNIETQGFVEQQNQEFNQIPTQSFEQPQMQQPYEQQPQMNAYNQLNNHQYNEPQQQTLNQPQMQQNNQFASRPVMTPEQPIKEYQLIDNTIQYNTTKELNNPANYPNGVNLANNPQDIIVPTHANIDVSKQDVNDTPAFQSMPEIDKEPDTVLEPPSLFNKNPATSFLKKKRTTSRRKKSALSNPKLPMIIAGIGAGIFILILVGFVVLFLFSYNEVRKENGQTKRFELNDNNSYRVGSKDYGYVSVPNSWTPFGLDPNNQTIQYTDGAGWIVTLYSVDKTTVKAKDWANNIIAQMTSVGAEDIGIDEIEINDFPGYKLFGYYGSVSTYLAAWVLNGNDDKVHYVAIEGPERYNDFYDIINTFNTKK